MKNKKNGIHKINTSGGAFIGGSLSMGNNGKFVGRDDYSHSGIDSEDAARIFASLITRIDSLPNLNRTAKDDLKSEIEDLRNELGKKDQADESYLMRRLRNIGRIAPDILEVTLATITNPVLGLGILAKKIAEKAKFIA